MTKEAYDQVSRSIWVSHTNRLLTSLVSKVVNAPREAKLSHELIAAAASYEVRYPLLGMRPAHRLVGRQSVERSQGEKWRDRRSCHGKGILVRPYIPVWVQRLMSGDQSGSRWVFHRPPC